MRSKSDEIIGILLDRYSKEDIEQSIIQYIQNHSWTTEMLNAIITEMIIEGIEEVFDLKNQEDFETANNLIEVAEVLESMIVFERN